MLLYSPIVRAGCISSELVSRRGQRKSGILRREGRGVETSGAPALVLEARAWPVAELDDRENISLGSKERQRFGVPRANPLR